MGWFNSCLRTRFVVLCLVFVCFPVVIINFGEVLAFTASVGQPYHGRLVNGVPFPNLFQGYNLRDQERSYTTPEVIGALLDAIDRVREQHSGTCDVFLGDFSQEGGGWMNHHRSHQNGRDVDVGMYLKGNRSSDTFVPMNEENLDVPKTWCLIEGLIRSQRVQYIFLDRRIQRLLYDYAAARGADSAFLERVFGGSRRAIINHVANHYDHIHVRFYTPWSTLAAHVAGMDEQKRTVIEMAQQAFLPKKVNYYVKGNESSLEALAQSFGVQYRDLCRWNQLGGGSALSPGHCLVFYKRGFELEPVHLAQALTPSFEVPPVQFAALRPVRPNAPPVQSISDAAEESPIPVVKRASRERVVESPPVNSYTVQRGDTPASIAKKNNMDLKTLMQMNGFKKVPQLKPGQKLKVTAHQGSGSTVISTARSRSNPENSTRQTVLKESSRDKDFTTATYTSTKGDTLAKIARRSGIPLDALCQMNGLKRDAVLKPGQRIRLAQFASAPKGLSSAAEHSKKDTKASRGDSRSRDRNAALGKVGSGSRDSRAAGSKTPTELKSGTRQKTLSQSKSALQGKNSTHVTEKSQSKRSAPPPKAVLSSKKTAPIFSSSSKDMVALSTKGKTSNSVKKPTMPSAADSKEKASTKGSGQAVAKR